MKMRMQPTAWTLLCILAVSPLSFGQQPPPGQRVPGQTKSAKYRTILTLAGAGGGFALGIVAGLAAYDDAKFANRKIWTAALISAAAGGVGGYFLGRALDGRADRPQAPFAPRGVPDALDRSLRRASLPSFALGNPGVPTPNALPEAPLRGVFADELESGTSPTDEDGWHGRKQIRSR